jgi:hypothetical protein
MVEHVAHMGKKKTASKILVRQPEGNRLFVRQEDNIKLDHQENV